MNVKKMAKHDAASWIEANKLNDVLVTKVSRIDGYGPIFEKEFNRLKKKALPAHERNIKKLQATLEGQTTRSGGSSKKLLLFAAVGTGVYLLYTTETGKNLRGTAREKLVTWVNKVDESAKKEEITDAGA